MSSDEIKILKQKLRKCRKALREFSYATSYTGIEQRTSTCSYEFIDFPTRALGEPWSYAQKTLEETRL